MRSVTLMCFELKLERVCIVKTLMCFALKLERVHAERKC